MINQFHYERIQSKDIIKQFYYRCKQEELLPIIFPDKENVTENNFIALTEENDGRILLASINNIGSYYGFATFTPLFNRAYKFDFCSFRAGFDYALEQVHGAFEWIFNNTTATSIIGVTPVLNRAACRLAEQCGFEKITVLPQSCYMARRKGYVDGLLVICTHKSLLKAIHGE